MCDIKFTIIAAYIKYICSRKRDTRSKEKNVRSAKWGLSERMDFGLLPKPKSFVILFFGWNGERESSHVAS